VEGLLDKDQREFIATAISGWRTPHQRIVYDWSCNVIRDTDEKEIAVKKANIEVDDDESVKTP